jgi:hypothetical protein
MTKYMKEVESQKKEKTVNLISITPIEKLYTQRKIKLQDVVLYNNAEGETLEATVVKGDNPSEVRAIEYEGYATDSRVSIVKATRVQSVLVTFRKFDERFYEMQKFVNSGLLELEDETVKCKGIYNLKYLKLYLNKGTEEEEQDWKIRPPSKRKKEVKRQQDSQLH